MATITWDDRSLKSLCRETEGTEATFRSTKGHRLTGLQALVRRNGTVTIRYRYKIAGKSRFPVLGVYPLTKAADIYKEYTNAVAKRSLGIDIAQEREQKKHEDMQAEEERLKEATKLTIKDLAETFLRSYKGSRGRLVSPKTLKEYSNHLDNWLLPKWGVYKVDAIPAPSIYSSLQKKAEVSPVQANRIQATLSVLLSWAVKNGYMESDPLNGRDKVGGKEEPKDRALDFDSRLKEPVDRGEILQFWHGLDEISPKLKYALRMILITGQRPGEVLSARWDEIVTNSEPRWVIPKPKNRKGVHKVPVTPMLQTLLDELKGLTGENDWLFPDTSERKPITNNALAQRVRKELARENSPLYGMEKWTPHVLRHTVTTHLGVIGYLNPELVPLLNHAEIGATQIYNHADSSKRIRVLLESWQNRLQAVLEGKPANNVVEMRR